MRGSSKSSLGIELPLGRRRKKWATKTTDNEVELLLMGRDGGSLMFCCRGVRGDDEGRKRFCLNFLSAVTVTDESVFFLSVPKMRRADDLDSLIN